MALQLNVAVTVMLPNDDIIAFAQRGDLTWNPDPMSVDREVEMALAAAAKLSADALQQIEDRLAEWGSSLKEQLARQARAEED